MSDIVKQAQDLFTRNYKIVLNKNGVLKPSRNKDPVNPPLTLREYESMEKDTSKYFLYYAAINAQFQIFKLDDCNITINCMVVGAGLGRLVDYCIDCSQEHHLTCMIYVIECNENANQLLQEKYKAFEFVVVFPPVIIRTKEELLMGLEQKSFCKNLRKLSSLKAIDLFVSELLGSFGDNECVSEILSTCKEVFGGKNCISIPRSYTTFLAVVSSPSLETYFEKAKSRNMHILGLPVDAVFLSPLIKLYEQSCTEKSHLLNFSVTLNLLQSARDCSVAGFAGYFQANLGHNIIIDTTPSKNRNTFYWETAFFPLNKSLYIPASKKIDNLTIEFKRLVSLSDCDPENVFVLEKSVIKVLYSWKMLSINSFSESTCNANEHILFL